MALRSRAFGVKKEVPGNLFFLSWFHFPGSPLISVSFIFTINVLRLIQPIQLVNLVSQVHPPCVGICLYDMRSGFSWASSPEASWDLSAAGLLLVG